ncbi:LysR family transcriptional regulator [Streptomyces violaceusniger]|uniref:LysR family transcriptional regulator n=1 Tax=Streptomyces TaxID=1883 RepID=UPI0009986DA2|nr:MULTISPECIES: LysR family transcriptional regulator [Streptomyces]AQW50463.1 LysR family transcriptional regulator [Streptomyces hygroscopicus]ASQ94324.1 LysR family transcriptional regulator [Streptomyces sp. 11-1-2]
MADLSLTGLRVVQAVVDTGSFTAAADALGYTQSAVSRQVAAMEAAAGAPLFVRGARGVTPSPAGMALARRAATVLSEIDAVSADLAGLTDHVTGRVSIAAFPSAAAVLVPRTLARLRDDHPALIVEFGEASSPTQLRQLRAHRIDVAVIGVGADLPGYAFEGLRRDLLLDGGLLLAVPADHRFAGRGTIPVTELRDEPWIVGKGLRDDPQFGAWPTLDHPRIAYAAREWPTRLGLVATGLGIAVLPEVAAAAIPAGVRTVRVDDPAWLGRAVVAVTVRDRSPEVTATVEALRHEAAQLRAAR